MNTAFVLDPRLAGDTAFVADLPLSRVLLMRDARFPWLLLVPRRAAAVEVDDLSEADQALLWQEVRRAGAALRQVAPCDKLNLGALGNIVRQLHVHVVARREGDAAWPGPVWGSGHPQAYPGDTADALVRALVAVLR
ncbi:MAG TPA: HIT family protein [Rhodanobacteraceae bacterium]|nr:HIT family protein [Rhodanobacteraceae bacterium]